MDDRPTQVILAKVLEVLHAAEGPIRGRDLVVLLDDIQESRIWFAVGFGCAEGRIAVVGGYRRSVDVRQQWFYQPVTSNAPQE